MLYNNNNNAVAHNHHTHNGLITSLYIYNIQHKITQLGPQQDHRPTRRHSKANCERQIHVQSHLHATSRTSTGVPGRETS